MYKQSFSTVVYCQGSAFASPDEPKVARPRTRSALAYASKKAARNTQSRIPYQNRDGNPSEASTLLLVKQILFESNRVDRANHAPVEAFPSKSLVQAKVLWISRLQTFA